MRHLFSTAVQTATFPRSAKTLSRGAQLTIVHAVFTRNLAGSERYCVELANQQVAMGHEVHVIGAAKAAIAKALSPRVQFHAVGKLFRGFRVQRLLSRLNPDVCHGHLSAACKILGRLSHQHHTVATLHVGYKAHQHRRIGGLICVNSAQAAQLAGYEGQQCKIWNWLPKAPTHAAPAGLRQKFGIGSDVFLVGAVGRLHQSKGVDVLISAFRATATDRAGLVIVGDGPQRAELEKLAGGDRRIHFLGQQCAVHSILRELDLFVSPSREESFGLAILEAMTTGVPVIATETAGPSEFLQDHPVSLITPGSISELSAVLVEAEARFHAGDLPKVAYDLQEFEPARRVADVLGFYEQVIEARQERLVLNWEPVSVAS